MYGGGGGVRGEDVTGFTQRDMDGLAVIYLRRDALNAWNVAVNATFPNFPTFPKRCFVASHLLHFGCRTISKGAL